MRAIGHISHQIANRALLAGVALLAGASVAVARPQAVEPSGNTPPQDSPQTTRSDLPRDRVSGEEMAMAIPRFPGSDNDTVALPHPLPQDVATLIRSIFRLQRQGAFAEAIASTTRLTDSSLLGDIEAERYLSPAYHPSVAELRQWLHSNAELADAPAIHDLLASLPDHGAMPAAPSAAMLSPEGESTEADAALDHVLTRNPLLDRTVQERAALGIKGARSAIHLVAITPGMTPAYAALQGGEVAQELLSAGDSENALDIARTAFEHGSQKSGFPAYIAGLAAWELNRQRDAVTLFEVASRAPLASSDTKAAAAFWAARAHHALGQDAAYRPWLQRAATLSSHGFYGLLAARMLQHEAPKPSRHALLQDADLETPIDNAPATPILTEIDVEAVASTPVGQRVFALLQVGEHKRAEFALRHYWPTLHNDLAMARSVQLVADAAGFTDLALQMADSIQAASGHKDPLPLPALHPRHGFTVDPALIYALTRLESNFNPQARSGAGAHGLMQLEPVTAGFVTGDAGRFTGSPEALFDPGLNLEIGQHYLRYLAHLSIRPDDSSPRGGDMIRLLAGYNIGPNAVLRWEAASGDEQDPFLYMERLPNPQTRSYVMHAMANLWTYADRLHLPKPSLETLARGEWPSFEEEQALGSNRARVIH